MKKWCMCTKLNLVARDMFSTCSICGGQDAYGKSSDRPNHAKKTLDSDQPPNKVNQHECTTCKGKAEIVELESNRYFCYNCIT